MRGLDKFALRLRSVFGRNAVEHELNAELRFHLDEQIAENLAAGMAPGEARAAALRSLGGVAQIAEECRDARNVRTAEHLWQDARFGLRMLAKNPGFTAVAVLTLALGLGLNTFAYSAVRALLFAGLPVQEPDRLVLGESLREGFDPGGTSLIEYAAQKQTPAFTSSALSIDRLLLLRGMARARDLAVGAASPKLVGTGS